LKLKFLNVQIKDPQNRRYFQAVHLSPLNTHPLKIITGERPGERQKKLQEVRKIMGMELLDHVLSQDT
jgi:hypothetical protein